MICKGKFSCQPKQSEVLPLPAKGCCQRSCLHPRAGQVALFFFFFTLETGPRRSLSLMLGDTRVYEPQIRAQNLSPRLLFRVYFFSSSSLLLLQVLEGSHAMLTLSFYIPKELRSNLFYMICKEMLSCRKHRSCCPYRGWGLVSARVLFLFFPITLKPRVE